MAIILVFGNEQRKWLAFRKSLEAPEESTDEQVGRFERYLAYAVAFRMEGIWIKRFEALNADTPSWYHPSTVAPDEEEWGVEEHLPLARCSDGLFQLLHTLEYLALPP